MNINILNKFIGKIYEKHNDQQYENYTFYNYDICHQEQF